MTQKIDFHSKTYIGSKTIMLLFLTSCNQNVLNSLKDQKKNEKPNLQKYNHLLIEKMKKEKKTILCLWHAIHLVMTNIH